MLQREYVNETSLTWPYYSYTEPAGAYSHSSGIIELTIYEIDESDLFSVFKDLKLPYELVTLSSFLIFLISLSPSTSGYVDTFFDNVPQEHSHFFLTHVPVLLKTYPEESLYRNVQKMSIGAGSKSLPSSDLFLRYPTDKRQNGIAVCSDSSVSASVLSNHKVQICSCNTSNKVSLILHYQESNFAFSTVKDDFEVFMNNIVFGSKKSCILTHCDLSTLKGGCDYHFPSSLHQPFNKSVSRFPHAIAIIDDNGQYTFSDLDMKINEIAHLI